MPSLLIQRRFRWLCHAHRMGPDRMPREILYGELREGVGRPLLRYKDVIKRDLRSALIDTSACEDIAKHRRHGGKVLKRGFQRKKRTLESRLHMRERREKNAQPLCAIQQGTSAPPATETATPGSGYTVIQDPAQIPSANHCFFETRMSLFLLLLLRASLPHIYCKTS